jgi:hypothetical protein
MRTHYMNINYDDIITKANARKNALKALEAKFTEVPLQARLMKEALQFFASLGPLLASLDAEGCDMLSHMATRARMISNQSNSALGSWFESKSSYDSVYHHIGYFAAVLECPDV